MALGDTYRITQNIELVSGTAAQNVYHLSQVSAGADVPANISLDIVDYMTNIYEAVNASMHSSTLIEEFIVEKFDTLSQTYSFFTSGFTNVGGELGGGNEPMPQGVAILVQARHVVDGFSGRKFFPGLTEGVHQDGFWISFAVADALLAALIWATPFAGVASNAAFQPVTFGDITASPKSISTNVQSDNVVAYQRRRKPGVGL